MMIVMRCNLVSTKKEFSTVSAREVQYGQLLTLAAALCLLCQGAVIAVAKDVPTLDNLAFRTSGLASTNQNRPFFSRQLMR
jgi:hypothetical protein